MGKSFFIFITVLLIVFSLNTFAQDGKSNSNPVFYEGNNTANPYVKSDVTGEKESPTLIQLRREIQSLREQNNPANNTRIGMLLKQLSKLNKNSVSMQATYYPGGIEFITKPPLINETDVIGNTRIFANSSRTIKGIGTAIEQRNSTKGRIWVVYAFSANTASPDSFRVVYSTNHGLSWISYANVWLSGTDKINIDDLDIELLEQSDGTRFLWAVYGIRAAGGTGKWYTGGFAINLNNNSKSIWSFSWPGNDAAKRYYNIRITTDNASFYVSSPHTYIACSFDSIGVSNWRINSQKFVVCYAPYDALPIFDYYGPKWFYQSASGPANYQRTLWTDIAYFRNNVGPDSDSLIVSFSGVPDSSYIWYAKARVYGAPVTGFSQRGNQTADYKYAARLISSDSSHGMASVFNQVSSGVNYIKYFRALNGDFAHLSGQSALSELYRTNSTAGVCSRRHINSFYFSYTKLNSARDSVRLVNLNPLNGITNISGIINSYAFISPSISPKPLFRNVYNDSCFAIYSENGPVNVWSAYGCSGAIIGIYDPVLPVSYNLSQNYPNPFNPVTTIEYSIVKSGIVKLTIFDILGNEVAALVNEMKNTGTYIVDFNASGLSSGVYFYKLEAGDFRDVKKMLLLK